jgi:hypothetical protein
MLNSDEADRTDDANTVAVAVVLAVVDITATLPPGRVPPVDAPVPQSGVHWVVLWCFDVEVRELSRAGLFSARTLCLRRACATRCAPGPGGHTRTSRWARGRGA